MIACPCWSFSIFNPLVFPQPTSTEFKKYGNNEITTLAAHFFQEEEDKAVKTAQLEAEWAKFKFDLESWKSVIPPSINNKNSKGKQTSTSTTATATKPGSSFQNTCTPLEWALQRGMKCKSDYGYFYPALVDLAEVALSAPFTNAWPERGASALKRIKTRLRNRTKNDMLNALLQVSVNGPATGTPEAKVVVQQAVTKWLQKKSRRLQRPPVPQFTTETASRPVLVNQGTQCDPYAPAVTMTDYINHQLHCLKDKLQQELHQAKKAFYLDRDVSRASVSIWTHRS